MIVNVSTLTILTPTVVVCILQHRSREMSTNERQSVSVTSDKAESVGFPNNAYFLLTSDRLARPAESLV
ncbi:hypothetical protein J6590_050593 [Homalodisca vitripennis]|nr:hypothetical protein J6590_050593 [Homalodisca vitripennis]